MYVYDEPDPIGAIGFALIIGVIVACNYIWENFAIVRIAYFIASVSYTMVCLHRCKMDYQ